MHSTSARYIVALMVWIPLQSPGTAAAAPCSDEDTSCWNTLLDAASAGCRLGFNPERALAGCQNDLIALQQVVEGTLRYAEVRHKCPPAIASIDHNCSFDLTIARSQLDEGLKRVQPLLAWNSCKASGGDAAAAARCMCRSISEPERTACENRWISTLGGECYTAGGGVEEWRCLCNKQRVAGSPLSPMQLEDCVRGYQYFEARFVATSRTMTLECGAGRRPVMCIDATGIPVTDCQPRGTMCCGGLLCPPSKKCLPLGPDPTTSRTSACVDADAQYCRGIGICPKDTECFDFGSKTECLPPRPPVCRHFECGMLFGPRECDVCCPAYYQEPQVNCDQLGLWAQASCYCAPKSPPGGGPGEVDTFSGPSLTIGFSTGTGISRLSGAGVTITLPDGSRTSGRVSGGQSPAGCASALLLLARQAGLHARGDGWSKVTIWGGHGLRVDVGGLQGECSAKCTTPNCSL
jgi:hypothetical protein